MAEPTVDVLAVLRQVRAELPPGSQNAITLVCSANPLAARLDAVSAAVAELIEADREYDKAKAVWDRIKAACLDPDEPVYQDARQRMHAAVVRRAAALARVGGAS